ncbi:MAG: hypothetical protein QGG40_00785 [Myxococcota bacterium]|nr:hypothetical protein [Myxococcota bacterium]
MVVHIALAGAGVVTGEQLMGKGAADIWGHTWGYWHVTEELSRGRLAGGWSDAVRFPVGQSWWIVDLPWGLLVSPITLALGATHAYHAVIFGQLVLGALGAALWLQRRGVDRWVSSIGAMALVCSPFVRGVLASGVPEALGFLLLPWLALSLEWAVIRGGWRIAGSALLAVFVVLHGSYTVVQGALVGVAVSLWLVCVYSWRRVCLVMAVVGGTAFGTWAWVQSILQAQSHPALSRASEGGRGGLAAGVDPGGGADLAAFLYSPGFLGDGSNSLHQHVVFVGVFLVLGAAVACWSSRWSRALVGLGLAALIVSLGSSLQVSGQLFGEVWLPGSLLMERGARNLYRIAGLSTLAFIGAVCAGARSPRTGARSAIHRVVRPEVVLVAALVEGLLASGLPWRTPTVDDPAGPFEVWLSTAPEVGAVIDLPFDREGQRYTGPFPQRTLHLQAHHGRAIASGLYLPPEIPGAQEVVRELERYVRQSWARNREFRSAWPQGFEPGEDRSTYGVRGVSLERDRLTVNREVLRGAGFAYVTLDGETLPGRLGEDLAAFLSDWLGDPVFIHEDRMAFSLSAPL